MSVKSNHSQSGGGGGAAEASNDVLSVISKETWRAEGLCIVVVGASGDLAKKKTYPSLFNLYRDGLLPENTIIWGYARSSKTHEGLRTHLRPHLVGSDEKDDSSIVDSFLSACFYHSGKSYGDIHAFTQMMKQINGQEDKRGKGSHNRLFYLAIPPNVFGETGAAIRKTAMADDRGWTRVVIEKPFGRDLQSCEELLSSLSDQFDENDMYRIDHYLGKEIVQNLLVLRFGNSWLEWMWNRNAISSIVLEFKEPFGTEGRGGYFDKYGIIRDILQNHLLQVLTLLAMEAPVEADGPDAGDRIRDAKVQVLKSIPPISVKDCILGQYDGYADDPTIEDKGTTTPTYAALRLSVNNPRWAGVPIILSAGKALNERKAEIRIRFKTAPHSSTMFRDASSSSSSSSIAPNELVMRLQPNPTIYMRTNVKSPGFSSTPVQSELEMNYGIKFGNDGEKKSSATPSNPDAYTRLILDVLRGRRASFVRDDELRRSWEIFTPLLHQIEHDKIPPFLYKQGTTGPKEVIAFMDQNMTAQDDSNYSDPHSLPISSAL